MYEITVSKLHEILGRIKDAGHGDQFVVIAFEGGHGMPITEILNAPVGKGGRGADYLMSEEEAKTAPDDTPQVICLRAPMMSPVGWLSRELASRK